MDQTVIDVPDYVTMIDRTEQPIPVLTRIAADLLAAAEHARLPMPNHLTVYRGGQHISLGFGRDTAACDALAAWAEVFSGTVTGTTYRDDQGQQQVYCQLTFSYGGIRAELSAFLPTPTTDTEDNTDD